MANGIQDIPDDASSAITDLGPGDIGDSDLQEYLSQSPGMGGPTMGTPSTSNAPFNADSDLGEYQADQPLEGGGFGGIMGSMRRGMAGQAQPPGSMIQQRHGGFLTGLAGILMEGLASGLAPTAQEASELPLKIQQAQMQKQDMALKQEQMQQEMQLAPIRMKVQLAQAHMLEMKATQMAQEQGMEEVMGKAQYDFATHVLGEGNGEAVADADSYDDAATNLTNLRNQETPTEKAAGLTYFMYPKTGDPSGAYQIYKSYPDGTLQHDFHTTLPGGQAIDIPAGTPMSMAHFDGAWQSAQYLQDKKDQQKLEAKAGELVEATDPASGVTTLMTRGQADAQHFPAGKAISPTDRQKLVAKNNQMNEIQTDVGRYGRAAEAYFQAAQRNPNMIGDDRAWMERALNEAGIAGDLSVSIGPGGKIELPGVASLEEATNRLDKAEALEHMSPEGRALVLNYRWALAAVPAYARAVLDSGRAGGQQSINLDLENILNPAHDPQSILQNLEAFNKNIDVTNQGRVEVPGVDTIQQVRQREGWEGNYGGYGAPLTQGATRNQAPTAPVSTQPTPGFSPSIYGGQSPRVPGGPSGKAESSVVPQAVNTFIAEASKVGYQQAAANVLTRGGDRAAASIKEELGRAWDALKPGGTLEQERQRRIAGDLAAPAAPPAAPSGVKAAAPAPAPATTPKPAETIQPTSNIWQHFSGPQGLSDLADQVISQEGDSGPARRNNNPGNLKNPDGTFKKFGSFAEGRAALVRQLKAWQERYPNWTFEDFNRRYAPDKSHGGDNPDGTEAGRTQYLINALSGGR